MSLDKYTFDRPAFYKQKADTVLKAKRFAYKMVGVDLDADWRLFLGGRESLLRANCTGKSVLDVGCGTGDLLAELEELCRPTALAGLDVSQAMVEEARRLRPEYEFSRGDSEQLPYKDNSFDVVTFQWVLHHLSPTGARKALIEAARVARDCVMIQDTLRYERGFKYHLSPLYWRLVDGGLWYATLPEWKSFITDTGFGIVDACRGQVIRTGLFVVRASKHGEPHV